MNEELAKNLMNQLNRELSNAYLYLVMASRLHDEGLDGFAHFFEVQAREELGHAEKIYEYLTDRGVRMDFMPVNPPKGDWRGVAEMAEVFYRQEVDNTSRIWEIYDLAKKVGDKATEVFLHWFINEQVEEEKMASDMVKKVSMVKGSPNALLMLDRVFGERK